MILLGIDVERFLVIFIAFAFALACFTSFFAIACFLGFLALFHPTFFIPLATGSLPLPTCIIPIHDTHTVVIQVLRAEVHSVHIVL